MNTKTIGDYGEKFAVKYLKQNGYKILERNYKTRFCEIDIIAKDGDTLCFVEVKTRSNTDYGLPCESVGYRKRSKIISGASYYVSSKMLDVAVRFDVAEVYLKEKGIFKNPEINIIKNAFDATGR